MKIGVWLILLAASAFADMGTEPKDELAAGKAVIAKLQKCLNEGQNESMVRACGAGSLAMPLTVFDQDRLWIWLRTHSKLGPIEACPNEALKYLPEEKMRDVKSVACASVKVGKQKHRALFLFSAQGSLRLANIRMVNLAYEAPPTKEKPAW